jgi:hypothetical protein
MTYSLWEKKSYSDWEKLLKFEAENLQKFWDHLNNLFGQGQVRAILKQCFFNLFLSNYNSNCKK